MSKDSWSPEQYHKFQIERAQPFFHLMALVRQKAEMDIVDLGCGSGELTQILHREFSAKSTLGTDNSPAMLNKCKQYAETGLTFKNESIESFIERDRYDLVFSNAALQWCDDHTDLFLRLRNSLKAGGQIAIQMPMNHDYPTHTIALALAQEEPFYSALRGEIRHYPLLDVAEYASLLYGMGFTEPVARVSVYGHLLESREEVIEWVKGTLLTYYESRFTPDVYKRFLLEFRTRLFKNLPDTKPFYYPFKRVLLWGQLET